jgi:hypothetical protein
LIKLLTGGTATLPVLANVRFALPPPRRPQRMAVANMGPMFPNAEQSERDIPAQTAAPPMVMTTGES